MDLPFSTELHSVIQSTWPSNGKVILYSPNIDLQEDTIILYQAYNASIADYAVSHQTFKNCPHYSTTRMTWLKPNFLWMMYRSGWATKTNQERILAITVKNEVFNDILRDSVSSSTKGTPSSNTSAVDVRLQWDPDHDPYGEKLERRAIQIGIRGVALETFLSDGILRISDISDFVREQKENVHIDRLKYLIVPAESIYKIYDETLRDHIGVDHWSN